MHSMCKGPEVERKPACSRNHKEAVRLSWNEQGKEGCVWISCLPPSPFGSQEGFEQKRDGDQFFHVQTGQGNNGVSWAQVVGKRPAD